ncbi:MAG: hypothetical protein ACRD0U_05380 [Acidimicrobiales bacterium]
MLDVFDGRAGHQRTIDATVADVPSTVGIDVLSVAGAQHVDYSASAPIETVVWVTDVVAGETTTIDATAADVPPTLAVHVDDSTLTDDTTPVARRTVTYSTNTRLGSLDVTRDTTAATGAITRVAAPLDDVPTAAVVVQDSLGSDDPATASDERQSRLTISTSASDGNPAIGVLEAGPRPGAMCRSGTRPWGRDRAANTCCSGTVPPRPGCSGFAPRRSTLVTPPSSRPRVPAACFGSMCATPPNPTCSSTSTRRRRPCRASPSLRPSSAYGR